jgi:hypothetical protein
LLAQKVFSLHFVTYDHWEGFIHETVRKSGPTKKNAKGLEKHMEEGKKNKRSKPGFYVNQRSNCISGVKTLEIYLNLEKE